MSTVPGIDDLSASVVKPRSVVFDLFGDHLRYHGGAARTQSLVAMLDVFGIGEPTARIVLARMRNEGWFDTHREGRQVTYTMTAKAWKLLDEGRTRIFDRSRDVWDGQWRLVIYTVAEQDRAAREQLRRTLSWLGFGPLATATWISPHDRLVEVGDAFGGDSAVRLDLLTCRSQGRETDLDMVGRAWNLETLRRDYEDFIARLEALPDLDELNDLTGPSALRLRIKLVADYRQFPFRDPDLPLELMAPEWPGRDAAALFARVHEALADPADRYVASLL